MESSVEPMALARELANGVIVRLLDVRQPEEFALAALPNARLIPLNRLDNCIDELLDWQEENVVVYCHHGIRSLHATRWLQQQGFSTVRNLVGGIDAWSIEVDPAISRYH